MMTNTSQLKTKLLDIAPEFSGVCSLTMNDEVVCEEAFGCISIPCGIPNRVDTRFAMASGCKAFTAAAILKLYENDVLSLDDGVCKHLPNRFPHMDDKVTVRHLLTHSSGFGDYFDESIDGNSYEKIWADIPMYAMTGPDSYIPLLRDKVMEFTPGERFKYNNGAYIILAMLIEQLTGTDFAEYIRKTIFDNCNMSNSGYYRMDALPENTAIGYTDDGKGGLKANYYSVPVTGGGDGGAFTTAQDMLKFWKGLRSGAVLSRDTVTSMWLPHIATGKNGSFYGYGFWLDVFKGTVIKIHVMGSDPGVSFRSAYYPMSNAVITVLCNRDTGSYAAAKFIEEELI